MEFLIYLIKVSGLLILFTLSYGLLLRKESFKKFNRRFLLLGLCLSFFLPALQLKKIEFIEAEPQQEEVVYESFDYQKAPVEANFIEEAEVIPLEESSVDIPWINILIIIYLTGLGFMLFQFSKQFLMLKKVLQSATKKTIDGVIHYQTKQPINAFSIFNYVIYCPNELDEDTLKSVLAHEYVHVKQWHSVDLMLANLAQIILWFNPLMFLYRKMLDENLEFIADQETVNQLANKKQYQYALLNYIQPDQPVLVGHYFFKNSTIKTRIMMLNKQESPSIYRFKSVVIIPILITFIALFQVETVAMQVEAEESELRNYNALNENLQRIAQQNPTSLTTFSARITSEATKKSLKEVEEFFAKREGVKLKFSRVKRDKNGEIKRIKINMQSNDGSIKVDRVISGNQPIPTIELMVMKTPGIKSEPVDLRIKEIEHNNEFLKKQSFEDWESIQNEVTKVIFNGKELNFDQEYLIHYFKFEDFNDGTVHLSGKIQETIDAVKLALDHAKTSHFGEDKKLTFFVLNETDSEGIKMMKLETKNSKSEQQKREEKAFEKWSEIRDEIKEVYVNGEKLDLQNSYFIQNLDFIKFENGKVYLEGKSWVNKDKNGKKTFNSVYFDKDEEGRTRYFNLDKSETGKIYLNKVESKSEAYYGGKKIGSSRSNKTSDTDSVNKTKFAKTISNDYSDEALEDLVNRLNTDYNAHVIIEKLSRNNNKEIKELSLSVNNQVFNITSHNTKKGLKPILVYIRSNDTNKIAFTSDNIMKYMPKDSNFSELGIDSTIEFNLEKSEENSSFRIKNHASINSENENNSTDTLTEEKNDINASVNITPSLSDQQNILYVVDGKEVSEEHFKKLNPIEISEVKVEKDSSAFPNEDVDAILFITTKKDKNKDTSLLLQKNNKIPWELLDQKEDVQGLMKYFNLLDDQIKSDFYNDLLENKDAFKIFKNDQLTDENELKKLDYKNILSIEKSEKENTIFIKTND